MDVVLCICKANYKFIVVNCKNLMQVNEAAGRINRNFLILFVSFITAIQILHEQPTLWESIKTVGTVRTKLSRPKRWKWKVQLIGIKKSRIDQNEESPFKITKFSKNTCFNFFEKLI